MEADRPTPGFLLHDVARLLKKRLEQHSRGSGLTRSQWQILACLAQNEGINQKGLAELLNIETDHAWPRRRQARSAEVDPTEPASDRSAQMASPSHAGRAQQTATGRRVW